MKLGRKPRSYNPSVPHLSALMAGRALPYPLACDYSLGKSDFGVMLNDTLGDCTCAAYYHARQIWSGVAQGSEITEPDAGVEKLYELSCGYDPANPSTDQGGVEQDVLTYLLNVGAPDCVPILGFFEIDPRNLDDIKRVIYESGVAYIGLNLPQSAMESQQWDVTPDDPIVGGHAVVLVGYNTDGFWLISWGKKYFATNAFIAAYCDEAYAIADKEWIENGGKTPAGLTLIQLEQQMEGLRDAD